MTLRQATGFTVDRVFEGIRLVLVTALIVVIPFSWLGLIVIDEHSPHLEGLLLTSTTLGAIDLVLGMLIVSAIATVALSRHMRASGIGMIGLFTFAAVGLVSLLFTPTVAGTVSVFRLLGVAATIVNLHAFSREQFAKFVVVPLAVVVLFQSTLALMQTIVLGSGFYVGSEPQPAVFGLTPGLGSFFHPYSLAAYLALSMATILSVQRFRPMRLIEWSAVALASAAMATTYGRTAALSVLLIGIVYGVDWFRRRKPEIAISVAVATLPAIVTGLILHTWWVPRASQTLALRSSGRTALIETALEIIGDNTLFGVGPAQYGPTLATMVRGRFDVVMVHDVPLMVAVEYGAVIGGITVLWLIALGVTSARSHAYALGAFMAVLPFLLLDNIHYVYPSGIASFGLWIAVLDFHSRSTEPVSARSGAGNTTAPR